MAEPTFEGSLREALSGVRAKADAERRAADEANSPQPVPDHNVGETVVRTLYHFNEQRIRPIVSAIQQQIVGGIAEEIDDQAFPLGGTVEATNGWRYSFIQECIEFRVTYRDGAFHALVSANCGGRDVYRREQVFSQADFDENVEKWIKEHAVPAAAMFLASADNPKVQRQR